MRRTHPGQSGVIVSGVLWNFLGQGWLLVVAFLATPYIVRTLQVDLYGLYSLAGFVLSYFAFLEFGLGAAVTKYISQYLAEDNAEGVVTSFWAGLAWLAAGGLVCVLVVGLLAEGIASSLLHVPARLEASAVVAFRISALILCVSMLAGLTGGTLRSAGRFGMVNLTSIVTGTAQTALSVGLLWAGHSLAAILWGMLVCQGVLLVWQLGLCLRSLPVLRTPRVTREALTRLLGFGGILTLASLIGPVLTNVEKLFMTRLTSLGLLTYYAVPFSLIDRLGVIPSAFGGVLYPSYSYFGAKGPEHNRELHYRGTLYICASYGFFACFFLFLGRPFLRAWMGVEFADRSAPVLGILAIGGLFNAMARPAITALQGVGKPHIPLVLQIVELVLYLPSAYFLIRGYGMIGAAEAWSGRVIVDALLLHVASCLELRETAIVYRRLLKAMALPLATCSIGFLAIGMSGASLLGPVAIAGLLITALIYASVVWTGVLDTQTRERMVAFWKQA